MTQFLPPWSRDEGLCSYKEEEHGEGADQIWVEHFISHLGKLEKQTNKNQKCKKKDHDNDSSFDSSHLVFYVCVLKHECQWSNVLLAHTLTASDHDGVFDAFVDLFRSGLAYVG